MIISRIADISEKILKTLELMGYKDMGAGEETLDLRNTSDDARKDLDASITSTIGSIRTANLVRGSEASGPIQEFKSYLRSIRGYSLKYCTLGAKKRERCTRSTRW